MDRDTKGIAVISETSVLSVVFSRSFCVFIQCTTWGPRIKKYIEESLLTVLRTKPIIYTKKTSRHKELLEREKVD